jgi:hypothetical protein
VLASVDTRSEPPPRDLFELALRLRPGVDGPVSRTVESAPGGYEVGHTDTFSVNDLIEHRAYTITATVKLVSDNAYWYVDDSIEVPNDDLQRAADAFENDIHPTLTHDIGDVWNPGVDNDPRLTVLHTPLRAVAGYFGSSDEFPRATHPQSNQREMIYMDGSRLRPGSRQYLAVLAHEFQHAVHWNLDSGEDSWVNEGMSEVASELAGYSPSFVQNFLRRPDTQLNYWPDEPGATPPHYGAATLFLAYLGEHYGGFENLGDLVSEPLDGVKGIEAYLSDYDTTFKEVFKDWVIANYLDEPEGPYGYSRRDVSVTSVDVMEDYGDTSGSIPQFATRYIDLRLPEGDAVLTFEGGTQVSQVDTECHSGRTCWWGNQGDSIDSKLTREFDLSGMDSATLEFWTWYSIEKDWDFAYVEVSTDDGGIWTILEGQHTTDENPVGNSYGHGFTGVTGGWVQESIDLSPYTGGKVLVRFEYITDDAVYRDGFVIDDIAIPELGYFHDTETDGGWHSEGFERIDNVFPQDYFVQVIEMGSDGTSTVRDMQLDGQRAGTLRINGFGSELEHAVVVISPATLDTHQNASFSLDVGPL